MSEEIEKDKNMVDERREFNRFKFVNDEIQVLSDNPILFGKIENISKGGLSFQYTPIQGVELTTDSINILPKDNEKYNIYHIGCQIIYDVPSVDEGSHKSGHKKRKCGIKYFHLKEKQNKILDLLLHHYVIK